MRNIIPSVRHYLKRSLKENLAYFSAFPDLELHAHARLDIREGSSTDLLSYKAPWQQSVAEIALKSTDKHEAGANICLINPFPADSGETVVAGDINS